MSLALENSVQARLLVALVFAGATAHAQAPSSSHVLSQLPDGEFKRQFIIDCTNCHQLGSGNAFREGVARTREDWISIVTRMMQYAGATTGFPIISAGRDPVSTAEWLSQHLVAQPAQAARPVSAGARVERADIREFLLPQPNDLAHDVAIDSSGQVVVTGMLSHGMLVLDTMSGTFRTLSIPVERANPRAIEVAANGDWWVLLGSPRKLMRRREGDGQWSTFDLGMYGHSVALGKDGKVWFNGHFTRSPEHIGYVTPGGAVHTIEAPRHPQLADTPGGPIPYELRIAPDGAVWMSELQGHRMLRFDPIGTTWKSFTLPTTISAPRRFDIDRLGIVWIPAYAANSLVRLDAASGATVEYALPTRDAAPYVARVHNGIVWVGTNASDEVYAFEIATRRWTIYSLPSPGAVIRHMVINPSNGDVWLAYGGSPGIPARVARLRLPSQPR